MNWSRSLKFFVFIYFCGILLIDSKVYGGGIIELKERVEVPGPEVILGEMVIIPDSMKSIIESLRSMVICLAPPPAIDRKLSRAIIENRINSVLRQHGEIVLSGANQIIIHTLSREVTGKEIADVAINYLSSNLKNENTDHEISIRQVPENRLMPARNARLETMKREYASFKNNQTIYVGFYNGKELFDQVSVMLDVRTFEQVIVAKKAISLGSIISPEDVELRREETTAYNRGLLKNVQEVIGKKAKRTIIKGLIFDARMVEDPPLIRRGDLVTLQAHFGTVMIETRVEARQDGRKGDLIQVNNATAKKHLLAEVIDAKTVVISNENKTKK